MRCSHAWLAALVVVLLTAGCTKAQPAPPPAPTPSPTAGRPQASTALPADATTIVPGTTATELALATSRALFTHAPAVVLAGAGDVDSIAKAATTTVDLGVPLLLTPAPNTAGDAELRAELTRLGASTVITVGGAATTWNTPAPAVTTTPRPATSLDSISPGSVDQTVLPDVIPPPPLHQLLVLAISDAGSAAAVATAHAAGARVQLLADPDPRASAEAIKALTGPSPAHVLALGSAFGSAGVLRSRIEVAATGAQLPGGGQIVFPGRRMVALYGHPGSAGLGVLGEQGLDASVARARMVAAGYGSLSDDPVVPAFEIIATVASSGAGSDGNYSNESPVSLLKPWVDAAAANGIYVVLDLQPGRADFPSQARLYAQLLASPNVGLALDPEWRMKPDQVPMQVIGSVSADEINQTGQWLEDFTRSHHLPQKVLMLHQFRLDMIANRPGVHTDYDDLKVVIHADGFGTTPQKNSTWNALHSNAPANVAWGWKNFYDEDKPTLTPTQTMAVKPTPVFVSYQ